MISKQEIPLRVAGYLRVSTDEQKEKYGISLQQAAIEGIIASKGNLDNGKPAMVLAGKQHLYIDEGVSGTTALDDRPAFLRLKEDLENAPRNVKPFDIVIVYRIDRFARKLMILLEVLDYLDKKEVQFISANESIDTTTPFGRAMLGIIGVIAELERETTKQRTHDGKKQAINSGVYMGSNPPFGYKKDKNKRLQVFDKEAKTVLEIFELFVVQKKNTQQIADHLTNKKLFTPSPSAIFHEKRKEGGTKIKNPYFWRSTTVLEIIKDEVYLGRYYYGKTRDGKRLDRSEWKISPVYHRQIIDNGTFAIAQARIREEIASRNARKTVENHIYLLSGLLKCKSCHDPYLGREPISWSGTSKLIKKNGRRAYYYHCGAKNVKKHPIVCSVIPFPAEEIEQFVVKFVKDLLEDPKSIYNHINSLRSSKARQKLLKGHLGRLTKDLNCLPSRRVAIMDMYEKGDLRKIEYVERMDNLSTLEVKLKKELSSLQLQIGEGQLSDIYVRTFNQFAKMYKSFLDGTMKDRQEISDLIHLIVDRINVYARHSNDNDIVAGRKKSGQMIPHEIRIDLRLPQDILRRLAKEGKFEVRNDNLWTVRDLNP